MNVRDAIDCLETQTRPGEDLQEELFLFISSITPLVNVDLLIKDSDNRTLLTWRDDEFYGKGWHVPGGIIRFKEHAQDRIQKVAALELGCSVKADSAPLMIHESFSSQRQRGHFISLLYRCELKGCLPASLQAHQTPERGQWKWHEGVPPELLLVHHVYAPFMKC